MARVRWLACGAGLLIAGGVGRAQEPAQGTVQVRTVATIGADVVITDEEVWQIVRQRLALQPPEGTLDQQKVVERRIFNEELAALIERELILIDFLTKLKKNNPRAVNDLTEEAKRLAQVQLDENKKQMGLPDETAFQQVLARQGVVYPILMRQFERQAMLNLYLQNVLRDKGKTISLAEVERFYTTHPQEFKVEDRVVWQDLFVSYARFNSPADTRLYADWLLKQARAGTDFTGLVREFGHGDSVLRDGAGIGTTPASIQPAELAPTVLALKPGEVSDLIPTEFGIHIVKVTERQKAGLHPFDTKVQAVIRNKLTGDERMREKERIVSELRRKTPITVVEQP